LFKKLGKQNNFAYKSDIQAEALIIRIGRYIGNLGRKYTSIFINLEEEK
jgi:hypothetical protein